MSGFYRDLPVAVGLLLLVLSPAYAPAQVLSPGKLSEAHAHLEGLGNCTQCHQLRTRGIDRDRCLSCHEPLAARIREGEGYHGALVETDCGGCHKEHLGKNFRVMHFDAESFDHDSTGYTLRGHHEDAECRACHTRELIVSREVLDFKGAGGALDQTFLGLGTECATCHDEDDPHGNQFGDQRCSGCHNEEGWEGAAEFDHARAAYPLEGRHREVECGDCHTGRGANREGETLLYRPVEASDCRSCHEDPHRGRLSGSCSQCHGPEGWSRIRRGRVEGSFDHRSTRFPLEGAHERARCASCHDATSPAPGTHITFPSGEVGTRAYPRPRYDQCSSCHSDPHAGAFEEEGCDGCHTEEAWSPTEFGLERHDRESTYSLTGAHRVTPCSACHESGDAEDRRWEFRIQGADDCGTCHGSDDPHEGVFGNTLCETCHDTGTFLMETFDHDGAEVQRWIQECTVCHGATQPHGDQFLGRECRECHSVSSFEIPDFDHSQARFALDGAHREVPCDQCHRRSDGAGKTGSEMVIYRPLELACIACHRGGQ